MKRIVYVILILVFLTSCNAFYKRPVFEDPHPAQDDVLDEQNVLMRRIPAGEFIMGSDSGDVLEKPAHNVWVDEFLIDKYEVSNSLYFACVMDNHCESPAENDSHLFDNYYSNDRFQHFPVIQVTWQMAKTFCEWRGARLPTNAEWERAASGPGAEMGKGSLYPWGNTSPNNKMANYKNAPLPELFADVTPVGGYESDKSFYGVYDMAGNVREWTADWIALNYYSTLPTKVKNPTGPDTGEYRGMRGGSFYADMEDLYVYHQQGRHPNAPSYEVGIRCVR